jgi:hypothetical protein
MHPRSLGRLFGATKYLWWGGDVLWQVQVQMCGRFDTLLTDDERKTFTEQLPARYAAQADSFELLKTAVSGWHAHIEINEESFLLSIEHANHVVVCSIPKAKNSNGCMCVKLKWEQGNNAMVWIGICNDLRSRLVQEDEAASK